VLDNSGQQVGFGAAGLSHLVSITDSVIPELKECTFNVACDVTNPLCGENGCSAVFAPQKGADDEMIVRMDGYLRRYAELTKRYIVSADPDTAGTGAAGGPGFALMYYLNARLESGIDLIIRWTELEEAVKTADIVLTGEGCLDGQSAM
jgi:glycerate kinase